MQNLQKAWKRTKNNDKLLIIYFVETGFFHRLGWKVQLFVVAYIGWRFSVGAMNEW